MAEQFVGIFFCCREKLEVFSLSLEQAEHYGDFLIYPYSHDEIWEKHLRSKYGRDYAFYPRGRIMYNTKEKQFWIYSDRCIPRCEIEKMAQELSEYIIKEDEHYVCHNCERTLYIPFR